MEMEREKREEQEHAHQGGLVNHGSTLQSEVDLSEHDEASEEHHDEFHHVDYSNFTKQQFADLVKELSRDDNFKKVDHILREIKPIYDDLREKERAVPQSSKAHLSIPTRSLHPLCEPASSS